LVALGLRAERVLGAPPEPQVVVRVEHAPAPRPGVVAYPTRPQIAMPLGSPPELASTTVPRVRPASSASVPITSMAALGSLRPAAMVSPVPGMLPTTASLPTTPISIPVVVVSQPSIRPTVPAFRPPRVSAAPAISNIMVVATANTGSRVPPAAVPVHSAPVRSSGESASTTTPVITVAPLSSEVHVTPASVPVAQGRTTVVNRSSGTAARSAPAVLRAATHVPATIGRFTRQALATAEKAVAAPEQHQAIGLQFSDSPDEPSLLASQAPELPAPGTSSGSPSTGTGGHGSGSLAAYLAALLGLLTFLLCFRGWAWERQHPLSRTYAPPVPPG
jgi:hypothetical protein